jgi:Microcystin-dependent protein
MDEPALGEIQLFAFSFAVTNYVICSGQILTISSNQALFSVIGITYGGNGTTTFALPNMLGMEPLKGMTYQIAIYGDYPQRN